MLETVCALFQLITKCVTSRGSDAYQLTKVSTDNFLYYFIRTIVNISSTTILHYT